MAERKAVCSPDVVAYTTVIDGFFKERNVNKACDIFNEMVQQGISPNLVTYNSVVDALCKARATDKGVCAKYTQQVNICSFVVRCDRIWPSTQ